MKNILIPSIVATAINALFCQTPSPAILTPEMKLDESGHARFEMVIETPGTKDELFLKGKEWVFKTFNSSKSVIQSEDKEAGVIMGKAATSEFIRETIMGNQPCGNFSYKLSVGIKDGKARLVVDGITYESGQPQVPGGAAFSEDYPHNWPNLGKKSGKKHWEAMKAQALAEIQAIFKSFQQHMYGKPESEKW